MTAAVAAERSVVVDTTASPNARLRPVAVSAIDLTDTFWQPRRDLNRTVTLPRQLALCEETGRLDNFRRVADGRDTPFQGRFFNDSDLYKWLEAAAWTLASADDAALAARVDAVIAVVATAQDRNGYLNTYFSRERRAERWSDLGVMHELYCAGHLFQTAIAHHRATGKTTLLSVAERLADHIDTVFGPSRSQGTCGHPEIEMGLIELGR
ncbi:MAG: glycoside hydrolase family 127 protein, partial [Chloroflexota bacterium]|nr:glycoside hydrolase family 127 protein [Chloroflexota bacterium]